MNVSRRAFLSRGSMGVALAGAAALVPAMGSLLKAPAETPIAPAPRSDHQPLVAHVRDASSGEISLMVGGEHVVVRDLDLASRLYGATAAPRLRGR